MKPLIPALCLLAVWAGVLPAQAASDPLQRAWCVLHADQFDLVTDLDRAAAEALIRHLVRFDQAASAVLGRQAPANGMPVKVLAFARRRDFERVFGARGFAGFMSASLQDSMLIVGPDTAGAHLLENARHEYAHHLLRNDPGGAYPLWYEEGMASYLATLEHAGDGIRLGAVTKHHPERIHGRGDWREVRVRYLDAPTSLRPDGGNWLRRLVDTRTVPDGVAIRLQDFYQRSWLLVHLLRHGQEAGFVDRRAALAAYLHAVRAGDDAVAALGQATGESLVELARDVDRYRERQRFPGISIPMPPGVVPDIGEPACLAPAEVAYELGLASSGINPAFARHAFDGLIERSSDDARAYVGFSIIERRQGEYREAWRAARHAMILDTHNARARVEAAAALVEACREGGDPACRQQWQLALGLYQQALELEPGRLDAAFGAGVVHFLLGRPREAIAALEPVHRRVPWAPRISLFLGEAYRLAGDPVRAAWHLSRAARWEVEPAWQAKAGEAMRLLPATVRRSG